jgi:hypothetical protein
MSNIKNLLEKMDAMSAAERKPTGPKWPGYWRGTDSAKKSRSKMVGDGGAAESMEEDIESVLRKQFMEYGAPGSGISGEPGAAEDKAAKEQMRAGKQQIKDQIVGLVSQLQGARAQLADLNKGFPQGANPVEKAMSLQQMQAQKVGVKQQIEALSSQIAQLRQQAI